MSEDQQHSRRYILKLGGTALATGASASIAGCNTGAQNDNETPSQNNSGDGNQDPINDTQDQNNDQEYQPRITHGEEFDWFPDPRRFANNNLLNDDFFAEDEISGDQYDEEEVKKSLVSVPWQIYRMGESVNAMSSQTVDKVDELAPQVTGSGFVDADYSDMGTKVVLGEGELGAADIKGMTPDQIKQALEGNLEQTEERNGRTLYEGPFVDQRFGFGVLAFATPYDKETFEVQIGHEKGGNNIIWAASRPESEDSDHLFNHNDIEDVYRILDQTTMGNLPANSNDRLESVTEGDNHRVNDIAKIYERQFPDENHNLIYDIETSEGLTENDLENARTVSLFKMQRWTNTSREHLPGRLIRNDSGTYDLEISREEYQTPSKEGMVGLNFRPED